MPETEVSLEQNWEVALTRIFPAGIPSDATWNSCAAISSVLNALAAPNTGHLFYPHGGGGDLVAAKTSSRSDRWLEFFTDDSENWPHIIMPSKLRFYCEEGCVPMAHFILENQPTAKEPEFPASSNKFYEEYAEAPSGKLFTHSQWDNNDDGNENHLPEGTVRVMRYWNGGTIAIFAKSSPYNQVNVPQFDAYQAAHLDENFSHIVSELTRVAKRNTTHALDL